MQKYMKIMKNNLDSTKKGIRKMTYAVVLAGGVGSRFWPFSREFEPKQFMKIVGKESLLQVTVKRLKGVFIPANIFIVTNKIYFYEVLSQIKGCGIPQENIILEPQGKNTAAAIGLCARLISNIDKDAVLVVLPTDHYIKNLDKFKMTIQRIIDCSRRDLLVTIGIKPRSPSVGYGYMKVGARIPNASSPFNIYKVKKFLEKPSFAKANKYFKDKRFYWNSGIFAWKASVFLGEVKKYLPALYRRLMLIKRKDDIARVWPGIKAISVDYGIMEHSRKIALIPASFYWTDLGSWDALSWILPKDNKGNLLSSDTINLGSTDVCVFSRGNRLISIVGLKDLIIADTPDALLVCRKDKAQEVKKIAGSLKNRQRKEYFIHLKNSKG